MELIDNFFFKILVANNLTYLLLTLLILHYDLLLIFFVLRVLHAIMSEIESLSCLNYLAKPSAEIGIVYLRCFLGVFHLDQ